MVQDANGYVTLIVGMGEPQPSWVTEANGYTWLDFSKSPNFSLFNQIAIRDILPAGSFQCSGNYVPFKVAQATDTTQGTGVMGQYAPLIDYPVATTLPAQASPVSGPTACAVYPDGPPASISPTNQRCYVAPAPSISITAMSTQCDTPGCNQLVAQTQPPISILGTGFGTFPRGLPYTGTSSYLEVADLTQKWTAGYTGSACSVSVGEWDDNMISLVTNVNSTACAIAAGDQVTVTVTNPQTNASTSVTATVAAPTP